MVNTTTTENIQITQLFIRKVTQPNGKEFANLVAKDIKNNEYRFIYKDMLDEFKPLSIEQL
jgi:hypothetical protein